MPGDGGPARAMVTGAGQGLGYELCRIYLSRGWTVFPVVRTQAAAARYSRAPAGRCHPIVADLGHDDAGGAVRAAVTSRADRVDLLVNSAGIPGDAVELALVTPQELHRLLDVHCVGVVRCTQAVLPELMASNRARVINVTSRVGSLSRNATGEFASESISYSYRIAKAAQNMLTVCMSEELGRKGIVVCAVHPGTFRSRLNPDAKPAPAAAAQRMVRWVDGVQQTDHGTWHDTDGGLIRW